MTAITVGTAATIPAKARALKKEGLLARLWASFIAARMHRAEREIRLHSHLLPGELQRAGERLAPRTEKELPFAR